MARKPLPALGNVNALSVRWFIVRGERHTFNSTTVDLARAAYAQGVRPGDTLSVNYGCGFQTYVMLPEGGGTRTPEGVWVDRPRDANGAIL